MKKILLIVLALLCAVKAEASCASPDAQTRFLVTGGSGVWTGTNNWSLTSGGASGAAAPTATEDVCFDSNSGAAGMSLNAANRNALSLTSSAGYTGTFAFGSSTLIIATGGSVTLHTDMVITGTGSINCAGTCSLTSGGETFPGGIFSSSSSTMTFADSWIIQQSLTNSATNPVMNSTTGTVSVAGSVALDGLSTGTATGTIALIMNGTGSLTTSSATSGSARINIEINTAGTVTIGSNFHYQTGILKYTAGTVSHSGTLTLTGAATITANASGLTFATISILAGNQTWNGTQGFTMAGLSQLVAGGTHTWGNASTPNTYDVTSSLILTATSASHVALAAAAGGANLNFSGSTVALVYANFTSVPATGTPLQTYQGTVTTSAGVTQTTTIPTGGGTRGVVIGG